MRSWSSKQKKKKNYRCTYKYFINVGYKESYYLTIT
jgi:hypothetical protein